MSYTEVDICNLALGKLGGAGDQVDATGQISSLSDTDPISVWCNTLWPKAREQVFIDLAELKAPARESVKYAELDQDLTADDVTIEDITVSAGVITVTTDEVHGKSTGDTVVLKGIDGTEGIYVLNGVTYTITVVTTTTFTLDSTTGLAAWTYTENTGRVSEAPEMGPYNYAFDLPSAAIAVVRVTDELFSSDEDTRKEYRFDTMLNRDEDGLIIVTNDLTNADGDGIYIAYAIDQTDTTLYKIKTVEAMATLLASELAPLVGRNTTMRLALKEEYLNVSLPDCVAQHQSQRNKSAKKPEDFRGGRNATLNPI